MQDSGRPLFSKYVRKSTKKYGYVQEFVIFVAYFATSTCQNREIMRFISTWYCIVVKNVLPLQSHSVKYWVQKWTLMYFGTDFVIF